MAVSSAKFTVGGGLRVHRITNRGSEKHLEEDAYSCEGGNFEGVVMRRSWDVLGPSWKLGSWVMTPSSG